jgi:hypothetical protein
MMNPKEPGKSRSCHKISGRLSAEAERHKEKPDSFYPLRYKHAAVKITNNRAVLTVVYLLTNQANATLKHSTKCKSSAGRYSEEETNMNLDKTQK